LILPQNVILNVDFQRQILHFGPGPDLGGRGAPGRRPPTNREPPTKPPIPKTL